MHVGNPLVKQAPDCRLDKRHQWRVQLHCMYENPLEDFLYLQSLNSSFYLYALILYTNFLIFTHYIFIGVLFLRTFLYSSFFSPALFPLVFIRLLVGQTPSIANIPKGNQWCVQRNCKYIWGIQESMRNATEGWLRTLYNRHQCNIFP